MANPVTKNMRHGRIRIVSGDTTPLEKVADFTDGNTSWEEAHAVNVVRSRGRIREVTRGDEQPVKWSFTATFRDKTLLRTLRDKVFDGQSKTQGGLTAGADNTITPAYAFEQNSVLITTAGTWTKDAVGTVPSVDNHYAEAAGEEDVEGVIRATTFVVQLPVGVTSIDYTYDAVGKGTLGTDQCQGGVKAFDLILDIFDPCDPPDPDDAAAGTVVERYKLTDAYLESLSFAEGDEADKLTFGGSALLAKVSIETVA